jgi:hypothetical protein
MSHLLLVKSAESKEKKENTGKDSNLSSWVPAVGAIAGAGLSLIPARESLTGRVTQYHGTSKSNAAKIKRMGILPNTSNVEVTPGSRHSSPSLEGKQDAVGSTYLTGMKRNANMYTHITSDPDFTKKWEESKASEIKDYGIDEVAKKGFKRTEKKFKYVLKSVHPEGERLKVTLNHKQWDRRIPDRMSFGFTESQLNKQPRPFQNLLKHMANKGTDTIPTANIHGTKGYERRIFTKDYKDYAKKHPVRLGAGMAGVAAGSALGSLIASAIINRNKTKNKTQQEV